jgi:hypothetical protein
MALAMLNTNAFADITKPSKCAVKESVEEFTLKDDLTLGLLIYAFSNKGLLSRWRPSDRSGRQ